MDDAKSRSEAKLLLLGLEPVWWNKKEAEKRWIFASLG